MLLSLPAIIIYHSQLHGGYMFAMADCTIMPSMHEVIATIRLMCKMLTKMSRDVTGRILFIIGGASEKQHPIFRIPSETRQYSIQGSACMFTMKSSIQKGG